MCSSGFENPWARTFLHFNEGTFLGWQIVIGRARTRAHVPHGLYSVLQIPRVFCTTATYESSQNSGENEEVRLHLSRQAYFFRFLIWRKPGLVKQPPLLSKIPSAAWHSWLRGREPRGELTTKDVAERTIQSGNLLAVRRWSRGNVAV